MSPSHSRHQLLQGDGIWFKCNKIYLSPTLTLIPKVMSKCHFSPISGNFGFHKTLSRLKQSFVRPKLDVQCTNFHNNVMFVRGSKLII